MMVILPLCDRDGCKNFVGSVALVGVCSLQIIVVGFLTSVVYSGAACTECVGDVELSRDSYDARGALHTSDSPISAQSYPTEPAESGQAAGNRHNITTEPSNGAAAADASQVGAVVRGQRHRSGTSSVCVVTDVDDSGTVNTADRGQFISNNERQTGTASDHSKHTDCYDV